MEPIFERELVDAGRNRAIDSLRVQQLDDGEYSVIVKLSWKPAEQQLMTQKKRVRGWADLNRLLGHIRDGYGITSKIDVTLSGEKK